MRERHVVALFALCAGVLVVGTVLAVVVMPNASHWRTRCSPDTHGGDPVAPAADATEAVRDGTWWRATRTLAYPVEGLDEARAFVYACTSLGRVTLGVGPGGGVSVEATVVGQGHTEQDARAEAHLVEPVVRLAPGTLVAHEPDRHGTSWDGRRASVSLRILVPATMLVQADLGVGTGKVVVDGPRLRGLEASTGTGSIELRPSWAEGRLDLSTGTGSIEGRLPALGNATIDASTGTASIALHVPAGARHGYDIDASAGTGSIELGLPDLEGEEQRGHHRARTRGFEARPVQVAMDLSTGTGRITVTPT